MDRALPFTRAARTTQRSLQELLFRSPLAAFAIPLLVPLVLLFV
jgi:hypothetical protein